MHVGVLALQGGFSDHKDALLALSHRVTLVRYAEQLEGLDGLVLPGGESSTMLHLLDREGLEGPVKAFGQSGRPVLCTCAGLILAAARVHDPEQRSFGWLDVSVRRNAWGRQLDSFEARADESDRPLVFIRAPRISRVAAGVTVLATWQGEPVLVRQGAVTGATFHPELTGDRGIHEDVFGRGESA